jgi:hypothetical protein
MGDSSSAKRMSAKCDDNIRTKRVGFIRQSSIKCIDANFQAPKNGGVQRPPDHLDFRAHDPIVVFNRVNIEVCALLG